jgi:mono/diheme cytochrome c family protein
MTKQTKPTRVWRRGFSSFVTASVICFSLMAFDPVVAQERGVHDPILQVQQAQGMGRGHMMMETPLNPGDLETQWPNNKSLFSQVTLGGQAYDNWASLQRRPLPSGTHPAYPRKGKRKGATTWRCKECHGWDYLGVEGAYGTGSHYSGVIGITAARGRSPNDIAALLRSKVHGYTKEMIPDELLLSIAKFVSEGQADAQKFIDYPNKRARGEAGRGHHTYQHQCARCHGFNGRAINFGSPKKPEYVGTVANKAPWEALHKIRMGHPGSTMPAFGSLADDVIADLLSYIQRLPVK